MPIDKEASNFVAEFERKYKPPSIISDTDFIIEFEKKYGPKIHRPLSEQIKPIISAIGKVPGKVKEAISLIPKPRFETPPLEEQIAKHFGYIPPEELKKPLPPTGFENTLDLLRWVWDYRRYEADYVDAFTGKPSARPPDYEKTIKGYKDQIKDVWAKAKPELEAAQETTSNFAALALLGYAGISGLKMLPDIWNYYTAKKVVQEIPLKELRSARFITHPDKRPFYNPTPKDFAIANWFNSLDREDQLSILNKGKNIYYIPRWKGFVLTEKTYPGRYLGPEFERLALPSPGTSPTTIEGTYEIVKGLGKQTFYKAMQTKGTEGFRLLGKGSYLSPTIEGAKFWGTDIRRVEANIQNPLIIEPAEDLREFGWDGEQPIEEWAKSKGYDAIIHKSVTPGHDHVVIYDKEKVKIKESAEAVRPEEVITKPFGTVTYQGESWNIVERMERVGKAPLLYLSKGEKWTVGDPVITADEVEKPPTMPELPTKPKIPELVTTSGLGKTKAEIETLLGRKITDTEKEAIDTLGEGQDYVIDDKLIITHKGGTLADFEIRNADLIREAMNGFLEKEKKMPPGEITFYQAVKKLGGVAPYTKGMPGALREEYNTLVPIFCRNKNGRPLDEMASTFAEQYPWFGIETENDLLEAFRKEKIARMNNLARDYGQPLALEAKKLIFGKKPSEVLQKTLFGAEERITLKAKPEKPVPGQPELPWGARPEFEMPKPIQPEPEKQYYSPELKRVFKGKEVDLHPHALGIDWYVEGRKVSHYPRDKFLGQKPIPMAKELYVEGRKAFGFEPYEGPITSWEQLKKYKPKMAEPLIPENTIITQLVEKNKGLNNFEWPSGKFDESYFKTVIDDIKGLVKEGYSKSEIGKLTSTFGRSRLAQLGKDDFETIWDKLIKPAVKPEIPKEKPLAIERPLEMRGKDWEVEMPGEPELGKVINKTKIIQWAEKEFKVPIRGKATMRFKAAGMYYPKEGLIRLRKWGELEPMMHEIAHHLDFEIRKSLGKHWKKELAPLGERKKIIKELGDLDYKEGRRKTEEGFGEFIRHYLTTGKAQEKAPSFYKFFTENFLKEHPGTRDKLSKLKEMLNIWQKQGAENRILSQIDFKGEHTKIGGWLKKYEMAKDWLAKNFNDEFYYIKKIEDQMGIKVGVNIRPTEDPFTMATYMKSKASIIARTFVEEKAIDPYGNVVGKGLAEILEPIPGKQMKSWIAYGVAKRSLNLTARGIETGFDEDDCKFIIDKYQNPTWDKAAEEVTQWNDHGLDWIIWAGGLGPEEAKIIRDLNPVYLPFKRAFIDEITIVKGIGGYVNRGQAIKRIKGSGRPVINPVEGMIAQITELIAKAHKIKLARLIEELAKREGVGGFITKVAAPIEVRRFNIQQIKNIKGFLKDLGLDPENLDMDQLLTTFMQGWKYWGKDNICSFWEDGERVFYEMHPELYRALSGVDILRLPRVIRVLFAPFSRLVRLGATGLRFAFAFARNPWRDAFTNSCFSKRTLPIPVWDTVKGSYKVALAKTGSLIWRFKRIGGSLSGMMGLDRAATMSVYDNLLMDKLGTMGKVLKVCKHPVNSLRGILSLYEMSPRSTELEGMYKKYKEKHPEWSEEDCFVAAFNDAQDVTVNFTKSGYYAKVINEVSAFFNVAIRGPEKLYRSLRERPFATIIRGIMWLTIPSIIMWYKNRRKKWYKNLPPAYKYNNFFFDKDLIPGLGETVVRLPVPFELGILFCSAPLAALDVLDTKNPRYIRGLLKLIKMQIPNPTPSLLRPWIEVRTNKDFMGRPIETPGMQFLYPTERKRYYTRQLAISLSKAFNKLQMPISPIQIDYLINNYTGGWTEQIPMRPILERADIPVLGEILLRMPEKPQRQLDDFFSTYETLSQKKAAGIASAKERRQLARIQPYYPLILQKLKKEAEKYREKKDLEGLKNTYEKISGLLKRVGFE